MKVNVTDLGSPVEMMPYPFAFPDEIARKTVQSNHVRICSSRRTINHLIFYKQSFGISKDCILSVQVGKEINRPHFFAITPFQACYFTFSRCDINQIINHSRG